MPHMSSPDVSGRVPLTREESRLPSPVLTGIRFEGLRPFPHSQRPVALPCRSDPRVPRTGGRAGGEALAEPPPDHLYLRLMSIGSKTEVSFSGFRTM